MFSHKEDLAPLPGSRCRSSLLPAQAEAFYYAARINALTPGTTVTIAIPTLSAGSMLDRCLRSLNEQTFAHFEVLVINNGNQDIVLPPDLAYPCRILPMTRNIGFGAAINLAARSSPSPYIATLNDDTEPDPRWLEELVFEMAADPRTGMCASRIRLFDPDRLDSAGMLICLDGSSRQRGHGQSPARFGRTTDVLLPSACAALYRRRMLEDAGFFDEDFFLYCEDTDLGLRGQWAGWGCRYASGATVRHHYSSTGGAYSPAKALLVERVFYLCQR